MIHKMWTLYQRPQYITWELNKYANSQAHLRPTQSETLEVRAQKSVLTGLAGDCGASSGLKTTVREFGMSAFWRRAQFKQGEAV